jgi:cyclic dehypoxanthinyl futalosine synthase
MDLLEKALSGSRLSLEETVALYDLPLPDLASAAHQARLARTDPGVVTYLIDRNINYTNICNVGCNFCAFYRTPRQGDAYTLSYDQISEKVAELEQIGGTRILLQGGVNPALPFEWYLEMLRFLKAKHPSIMIDAFSPEEILGLEKITGLGALEIISQMKDAGLDGLPGAGGEILEDEVRLEAAPARIPSADWFRILDVAQGLGLYTISTMVIGFGETLEQRARHMLKIRDQQDRALKVHGGNGFAGFAMWTLQTEHAIARQSPRIERPRVPAQPGRLEVGVGQHQQHSSLLADAWLQGRAGWFVLWRERFRQHDDGRKRGFGGGRA